MNNQRIEMEFKDHILKIDLDAWVVILKRY